jgi:cobalt-zinc-cadmium efflux system outer membrane protein
MEMKKTMQGALVIWAMLAIAQRPGAAQEQHSHQAAAPSSSRFEGRPSAELAPDLLKDVMSRPAMKLSDFERMAAANNPTLRQAAAMAQRSAGQARQAGLLPNPSIGYQGEQIRGGSYRGGEQGAFIQQTFVLGGKLGLRRRVFEEQQKEADIGVAAQKSRVLADVGQAFYSALAAQEIVKLRKNLLSIATDAVHTARQLGNVGQADAPDILQAEVEAEQASVDYIAAQRQFLQEFQTLAALGGKPDIAVSPLAGTLTNPPQIDTDAILESILRTSPSVRRAQQGIATAQAELKSARRESIPNLQIRAGVEHNFEPINEPGTQPVGVQAFASAGVTIPIFNRNQGNVAAARAGVEQAEAEAGRVRLSVRKSAQPLIQIYLTDRMEAQRYKDEMIPRAMRAYQLYLEKYKNMASAYPQVIVSQRTLFQLQVTYVNVLKDLWSKAIALQNFTLSGGLDVPPITGSSSTSLNLPGAAGGLE